MDGVCSMCGKGKKCIHSCIREETPISVSYIFISISCFHNFFFYIYVYVQIQFIVLNNVK
jgi:hypothetical protein